MQIDERPTITVNSMYENTMSIRLVKNRCRVAIIFVGRSPWLPGWFHLNNFNFGPLGSYHYLFTHLITTLVSTPYHPPYHLTTHIITTLSPPYQKLTNTLSPYKIKQECSNCKLPVPKNQQKIFQLLPSDPTWPLSRVHKCDLIVNVFGLFT